jgi:hypothetical protein
MAGAEPRTIGWRMFRSSLAIGVKALLISTALTGAFVVLWTTLTAWVL